MKIGVVGNTTKKGLLRAVEALLNLGPKYDLEFLIHSDLQPTLQKNIPEISGRHRFCKSGDLVAGCSLIVAIGGDGTILSTARMVGTSQVPILGINLGKLGFLAEVSLDELESFISNGAAGNRIVEERSLLRVSMGSEPLEMFALNEVVIDKSSSSRVIHISVTVNNEHLVSFQGDGIIVATPTGSTGYALAAGGPIVAPAADVVVIQPISPHSLSARTVIVPETSLIRVTVSQLSDKARITVDGQTEKLFTPPASIDIRKADHCVKLVKRKDRSYYDVLRTKLFWGSDIRLMKGNDEQ